MAVSAPGPSRFLSPDVVAGLATLELLDDRAYRDLESQAAHFEAGLLAALKASGVRASTARVGSMLSLFLGVAAVSCWDDVAAADTRGFARLFHALLGRGVHLPPSPHEAWFLSVAHGPREVAWLLAAFDAAFRDLVSPEATEDRLASTLEDSA